MSSRPTAVRRHVVGVLLVAVALLVAACASPTKPAAQSSAAPTSRTPSATSTSATPTTAPPTSEASPASTSVEPPAAKTASAASKPAPAPAPAPGGNPGGKVVVLDPGHNGANAAHPEIINQPVPDGAGGTKPCNTTGTATNGGYPEHAFTWDVVLKVKALLQARGVTVVLTRPNDSGVGPCINERAAIGNQAQPAAVVSIHGDGAAAGDRGFFCMTSSLAPAGAAMNQQSLALAAKVRDSVAASGVMPVSNYFGSNGLGPRSDLAGLNLSQVPTTMCEMGNMRSAADAAVQTSDAGRQGLAVGIANGILSYIG